MLDTFLTLCTLVHNSPQPLFTECFHSLKFGLWFNPESENPYAGSILYFSKFTPKPSLLKKKRKHAQDTLTSAGLAEKQGVKEKGLEGGQGGRAGEPDYGHSPLAWGRVPCLPKVSTIFLGLRPYSHRWWSTVKYWAVLTVPAPTLYPGSQDESSGPSLHPAANTFNILEYLPRPCKFGSPKLDTVLLFSYLVVVFLQKATNSGT